MYSVEEKLEGACLLVRERLDGRRVDTACHMLGAEGDSVLGNHRLAGRRVCSNEDTFVALHVNDCLCLSLCGHTIK